MQLHQQMTQCTMHAIVENAATVCHYYHVCEAMCCTYSIDNSCGHPWSGRGLLTHVEMEESPGPLGLLDLI